MLYKTTTTCRSESNRESLHQTQCGPQVLQPGLQQTTKQFLVCQGRVVKEFLQQARQGRLVVGHRGVLHMVLGGIRSHDDPPKPLTSPAASPQELPPRYGTHPAAAVRMVRTLRAELGVTQGTVKRVATQLGYGVESVRAWVKQADIDDGVTAGVRSAQAQRVKELEQEVRELRRANEVLKRAASFFGAEPGRHYRK